MANPANKPKRLKKSSGLTIIELMITLVVLGVLLAIGLPEMRSFIVSNRLSSDVKGFVGLINYARSEAITRNQSVVICPKNNAAITCASSQFWGEYEVQAFVDTNGNGDRNTGEPLLKTLPAVDPTSAERGFVRTATGVIIFRSVGLSTDTHSFDIWAKSSDAAYESKYGRRVCVSRPGRVRVIAYNTTCTNF
jgi:type IV fimbrial biogenesis protein FimT